MSKKLPAFQFYPGDWLKDPDLRICSHFARGLLIDLLCMMFEANDRGYLVKRDGTPWSKDDAYAAAGGGATKEEFMNALNELIGNGVIKVDESTGCMYSSRMVKDEHIRQSRKQAGSKGGSKTQAKRKQTYKQNSTPSSSFSFSSSDKHSKEESISQTEEVVSRGLRNKLSELGFPHTQIHTPKVIGLIGAWVQQGITDQDLESVVTALRQRNPDKVFSPAYLEKPVVDYLEAKNNGTKTNWGMHRTASRSKQTGHDNAAEILEEDLSTCISSIDGIVHEDYETDIQRKVDVEMGG